MTLRTTGDTALVASLGRVAGGLEQGLPDGCQSAAEVLVADARGRAPKLTGKLARSGRAVAGVVGFPVPYGIPVHFGVPSRHQRAQPFLADAIKSQDTAVLAAVKRDVDNLLTEAVR